MRQQVRRHFAAAVVVIGTALSCSGCALWGARGGSPSSASLPAVQTDLEYAQRQTQDILDALDDLLVAHAKDLKQAYRVFSGRVERLALVGDRIVRHADGMNTRGSMYLVETEQSEAECKYPRLSDTAGTKPLELGSAFFPIEGQSMAAKRAYREFEADLWGIRELLYRVLNRRTVETAIPLARKARVDGESLNAALERALYATQVAQMAANGKGAGQQGGAQRPATIR